MHATMATINAVSTVEANEFAFVEMCMGICEDETLTSSSCSNIERAGACLMTRCLPFTAHSGDRHSSKCNNSTPMRTIAFDFQRDFVPVVSIGECDVKIDRNVHEVGFDPCELGRPFHMRS